MSAPIEIAKVKLVVIVAAAELLDGLEERVKAVGATGHTLILTDGRGKHGPSKRGLMGAGNVRIDVLLRAAAAQRLLEELASAYADRPLMAFSHDVDAIPAAHFR
jgi:hypothetical protein